MCCFELVLYSRYDNRTVRSIVMTNLKQCYDTIHFNLEFVLLFTHLPFLVNDGNSILQLNVIEETGQEDVSHSDQTVILLFVKEWVGTFEVRTHEL